MSSWTKKVGNKPQTRQSISYIVIMKMSESEFGLPASSQMLVNPAHSFKLQAKAHPFWCRCLITELFWSICLVWTRLYVPQRFHFSGASAFSSMSSKLPKSNMIPIELPHLQDYNWTAPYLAGTLENTRSDLIEALQLQWVVPLARCKVKLYRLLERWHSHSEMLSSLKHH